jgi:hypothetical protein
MSGSPSRNRSILPTARNAPLHPTFAAGGFGTACPARRRQRALSDDEPQAARNAADAMDGYSRIVPNALGSDLSVVSASSWWAKARHPCLYLAVISKFVDGQCLPTMTEMPKPESQPYRPLA